MAVFLFKIIWPALAVVFVSQNVSFAQMKLWWAFKYIHIYRSYILPFSNSREDINQSDRAMPAGKRRKLLPQLVTKLSEYLGIHNPIEINKDWKGFTVNGIASIKLRSIFESFWLKRACGILHSVLLTSQATSSENS